MLRPVGIIVVNGTRNVFLCQSFQSPLDEFVLGSARPGYNFFTDRHRDAAQCLLARVTPLLFTQYKSRAYVACYNTFMSACRNTS